MNKPRHLLRKLLPRFHENCMYRRKQDYGEWYDMSNGAHQHSTTATDLVAAFCGYDACLINKPNLCGGHSIRPEESSKQYFLLLFYFHFHSTIASRTDSLLVSCSLIITFIIFDFSNNSAAHLSPQITL